MDRRAFGYATAAAGLAVLALHALLATLGLLVWVLRWPSPDVTPLGWLAVGGAVLLVAGASLVARGERGGPRASAALAAAAAAASLALGHGLQLIQRVAAADLAPAPRFAAQAVAALALAGLLLAAVALLLRARRVPAAPAATPYAYALVAAGVAVPHALQGVWFGFARAGRGPSMDLFDVIVMVLALGAAVGYALLARALYATARRGAPRPTVAAGGARS